MLIYTQYFSNLCVEFAERYNLEGRGITLPPLGDVLLPPSPVTVLSRIVMNRELATLVASGADYIRIEQDIDRDYLFPIAQTRLGTPLIINDQPLALDVLVERDGVGGTRVALTALCGDEIAGIRDFEINKHGISFGSHGPVKFTRTGMMIKCAEGEMSGLAPDDILLQSDGVRHDAGRDSLFVREQYRGQKLGTYLLFSGLALAAKLDAYVHKIPYDESTREGQSFYSQFLQNTKGKDGWDFPLQENVFNGFVVV